MSGRGDRDKMGGGAEAHARFKQYDYRANSSLVLTSEHRSRDAHEPTGEPESLVGRMKGKMGDRAQQLRPDKDDKGDNPKKRDAPGELEYAPAKSRKTQAGYSVLDIDTLTQYRPRTKETRAAYEALLNTISTIFPDQPADVLRGAADEVLAVLKNQHLTDPVRHTECKELLGEVSDERFHELVALSKLMHDYRGEGEEVAQQDTLDQELGVAVELDQDEDEDGQGYTRELMEEDDDEAEEDAAGHNLQTNMDVDAGEEGEEGGLKVQEIDAYWLQRRVAGALADLDAAAAQELAGQVAQALAEQEDATAETKVVQLLGLDQFELARELLRNRLKIVWVTKLRQAQDDAEREGIEGRHGGRPRDSCDFE